MNHGLVDFLGALVFFLPIQAYFALGLHSIYKNAEDEKEQVEKETNRQLRGAVQVLGAQLRQILGQKRTTYIVVFASVLAGIAWAVDHVAYAGWYVPIWPFSLGLVEALVLFFSVQTVYHLTSKWLVPSLRGNRLFERIVTWTTLTGALILSLGSEAGCILAQDLPCSIGGYLNDFAFYLFFIILFVTGFGGIGLVDIISNSVSSSVPARRRARVGFFIIFLASLSLLYVILRLETPQLGQTALLGGAGLELALAVGLGSLSYWVMRRRVVRATSLVYIVLMFAVTGLFIGYNESALSLANLNAQNLTLLESIREFAIPLLLFSVGYIAILFQLPRKVERRFGLEEGKLAPSFTFLLLFTALATFQISNFSYGPSLFLSEKEFPVFLGLIVGGVFFTAKKLRKTARKGILKPTAIVPFCDHCLSQLEATSKFCPNCGTPVPASPEKVFFVGDGELLRTVGRHHSRKRKLASLIAGGPVGYLAFGRATVRKPEAEGQLVVTNKAAYLSGDFYPFSRINRVKPGNYSNSIILELNMDTHLSQPVEKGSHAAKIHRVEVEIKTSDPESFSKSINRAIEKPVEPSQERIATLSKN